MPGSVANAVAATVLPASLSRSFVEIREFQTRITEYPDGQSQRAALQTASRKRWRLAKRLAPTAYAALRDFWLARKAGHQAFYFYNGPETSPLWTTDATGVATTGRYKVVFTNQAWDESLGLGRLEASIELAEVV